MIETSVGKRTDVVFDVYLNDSIKNIKRVENRSATTILHFIQILPSHKMAIVSERSWKQKVLIQFLITEWRKETYHKSLQNKEI